MNSCATKSCGRGRSASMAIGSTSRSRSRASSTGPIGWALLIMADVPNSWGEPDEQMRSESEYALRGMIKRDYNHPAIFSLGRLQRNVGTQIGPEARVPAGNAGMGRECLPADKTARSDPAGRRQLALQPRPRGDRPQHVARLSARVRLAGGAGQDLPRHAIPVRRGTTSAVASRATSRCSTASAATSGATKGAPAMSTGAGTITS